MHRSTLSLFACIAGLALATGCDTTIIEVEEDVSVVLDRDTSEVAFEILTLASSDAFVDIEDESAGWLDDQPRSELTVRIEAESRGVLGLGIIDTPATAWVEDIDGELVSDVVVWGVDRDKSAVSIFVDEPFARCSGSCAETFFAVVRFEEEDARVRVNAEARLLVDYDALLGGSPVVGLAIDPVD